MRLEGTSYGQCWPLIRGRRILEVGLGEGMVHGRLRLLNPHRHVVVEQNAAVIAAHDLRGCEVICDTWPCTVGGDFDAIFLDVPEARQANSVEAALSLLEPGGVVFYGT